MILATVSLCLLFVTACSRQEGKAVPDAEQLLLQQLEAPDSVAYYECYVRMGKMYCLSATPDSMAPYLKATIDFAKRQPSSSRCNALLAYAYNCQAVNLHNFHKDPDGVIRLYHRADSLLGESNLQSQRPLVCANLADAYLFSNSTTGRHRCATISRRRLA